MDEIEKSFMKMNENEIIKYLLKKLAATEELSNITNDLLEHKRKENCELTAKVKELEAKIEELKELKELFKEAV